MKRKKYINHLFNKTLLAAGLMLFMTSCDLFKMKNEEEDPDNLIIATVGNANLYHTDIDHLSKEMSPDLDSAELVNRYIQSWVKKQLVIKEASQNLTINEAEINRKLLDYRYALIAYEYEKNYVEEELNKEVTQAEIEEYYQNNNKNFALKEIIVRTNFVKLEKDLPQRRQLERLLNSDEESKKQELKDFAIRYANNYFMEDSTWINFEDIILNTPLTQNNNHVQLIRNEKLIHVDDETYAYYFKILEYRLQDQVPPLEFVKDEISKIIVNKRRAEIAEKLKRDIYNNALKNNEFTIYE
ncbi:peptidyl-prolyl cis-trans isomerase [Cyclobacterium marinum]|uniref:peptidyl-prolyl cis-trans isomerase n=1 Tax=Cyclobacterium marinum TaxID=104 RepID=UPI00293D37E5|nr:peptidyl-prolyl cis-trans isomerase [Cyclobacterium marinum]|tara:strand:+ start:36117 stop:37013 length:897 start_codon:yes stop_codon:yes gene_type:complete